MTITTTYTTLYQDPVYFRTQITTSYNVFYQDPEDFRITNKFLIYCYINYTTPFQDPVDF